METDWTQRRSFRLHGGGGTFDVEIVRLEGSGLEVRETDQHGHPVGGSMLVATWDEARERVAQLVSVAVTEGKV